MLDGSGVDDRKVRTAGPDTPRDAVRPGSGGVSFLDLLIILLERKWFILSGLLAVSVGSVALVLSMTSYYTATAIILPSKQNSGFPFSSLLGDMPMGSLFKSLDILNQGDNARFLSILDSRRLADKVIKRFDLAHRYEFDKHRKFYYENLLKEYYKNVKIEEDSYENIRISALDSNPEFAAEVANYIVDQLDSISYRVSQEAARGSRLFFEERLTLMRQNLDSVHKAFAHFQVENNFIDLEQQVKSSIEALAGIEAEAMAADIEGEMLTTSFGSNSRIAEVQKRKSVLKRRVENYMQKGSGSLVLPLKRTPELAIKYAYLYRDVKVQETLYALTLQMYEQAKFREANNSPVVTVLERATPPQKRTRPKRMVFCLVSFISAFILLGSWVLVSHWYRLQGAAGTETHAKLRRVFTLMNPRR